MCPKQLDTSVTKELPKLQNLFRARSFSNSVLKWQAFIISNLQISSIPEYVLVDQLHPGFSERRGGHRVAKRIYGGVNVHQTIGYVPYGLWYGLLSIICISILNVHFHLWFQDDF